MDFPVGIEGTLPAPIVCGNQHHGILVQPTGLQVRQHLYTVKGDVSRD
jgi:hypothetical protein